MRRRPTWRATARRRRWTTWRSAPPRDAGLAGIQQLAGDATLLYYLTDELGVTALVAGLVVLLPKAWDVVLNPLVGNWSDHTESRWGSRIPWMVRGAVVLPVFFALMFLGPGGITGGAAAVYVTITFIGAATGFAFFQVPYVAQPAELTDDYAERTSLMTYRIAFLTLAILVFGAGAPALVKAGGDGADGYRFSSKCLRRCSSNTNSSSTWTP